MSDAGRAASDARLFDAPSGAAAGVGLSAGAMLRSAREKTGLHIGALAVALKVPVTKLEALEADRLDLLPDAVFARALASTICRALKLDPGPVLSKLPDQVTPRLRIATRVGNTSFDTPGMGWSLPLLSRLSKPAVITVAVLLFAALAVLVVPAMEFGKAPSALLRVAGPAGGALVAHPVQGMPVAPSAAPVPPSPTAPTESQAAIATVLPAPPAGPAAASDPGPSAVLAEQKTDAQLPGSSLVVFKARGASWVAVTDATGVVQLSKTITTGETVGASGTPPLSVIVGRADSIDVLVRGKPFDLAASTRDNIARFQIK